jgi:hypothetical protein
VLNVELGHGTNLLSYRVGNGLWDQPRWSEPQRLRRVTLPGQDPMMTDRAAFRLGKPTRNALARHPDLLCVRVLQHSAALR